MSITNAQFVHQMYITYLQRPAEPNGHGFWVGELDAGLVTREELAAQFGGSEEFAGRFTEANREELINEVYQALFGRDAEAEGLAFWMSEDVDVALLPTVIADTAADWDGDTLQNRLTFAEKLMASMPQEQYESITQEQLRGMLSEVNDTTEVTDEFVADVIAGVVGGNPALAAALAALTAAQAAEAAFFEEVEAEDADELETIAITAAEDVQEELDVDGSEVYAEANSAAQAAFLAEQEERNAAALAEALEDLEEAQEAIAEVDGLNQAMTRLASAEVAAATAGEALAVATANSAGAVARYNSLNDDDTSANANGTVDTDDIGSIDNTLFKTNANGTQLVLQDNVTEESKPGVTELLASLNASISATNANATAQTALAQAEEAEVLKDAENTDLILDLNKAQSGVVTAQDKIDDLAEAVAVQAAAEANVAKAAELAAATAEAEKYFVDLDVQYVEGPLVATAEDDIFIAGTGDGSISGFGLLGDDVLFIGKDYTLNTGGLEAGNDSVREVFFIQDGNNAVVTLEEKAYGSDSDDTFEITLTGVNAADLTLDDYGFVAVA